MGILPTQADENPVAALYFSLPEGADEIGPGQTLSTARGQPWERACVDPTSPGGATEVQMMIFDGKEFEAFFAANAVEESACNSGLQLAKGPGLRQRIRALRTRFKLNNDPGSVQAEPGARSLHNSQRFTHFGPNFKLAFRSDRHKRLLHDLHSGTRPNHQISPAERKRRSEISLFHRF